MEYQKEQTHESNLRNEADEMTQNLSIGAKQQTESFIPRMRKEKRGKIQLIKKPTILELKFSTTNPAVSEYTERCPVSILVSKK